MVVFSNREQLVLVRPVGDKLLGMSLLEYAAQVKPPAVFADDVANAEIDKDEANLARELLAGLTDAEPDLSRYQNSYAEKLMALIGSRMEGEELVTPPAEPSPPVINLMDEVKASVQQVKKHPRSRRGRWPRGRRSRPGGRRLADCAH